MPLPLLAVALLLAQEPKDPPRLRIDPPGRIDLGSLGPRERRRQDYRLRNLSGAPIALRILDLPPDLRVAGPALAAPIPPGAEAGLELTLDAAGSAGYLARAARLGTDDPRQGDYYLPVEAEVRPDLTVDGARRDFGDPLPHESPRVVFRFVRETGEPVLLRLEGSLPPYLEADLRPSGAQAELGFTFRPARVEPGIRLGLERVRVASNAPRQPAFDLYLTWRLHHPVEADPPRLVFQRGGPAQRDLRLTATQGVPFRLRGVAVEGGAFTAEPGEERRDREQTVRVRRTSAATARAMLVLHFEGQPEPLRVPLVYLAGD